MLGHKKSVHIASWDDALLELNIGFLLEKPKPLFEKLKLGDLMTESDPFSNLDLRVAKVIDVKDHPDADKLYILHIDLGDLGKRVLVAGMKPYYSKEEIKGKNIVIVTNLKPAKIRGIKSNGMLLAAGGGTDIVSLLNPGNAKPGSIVFIEGISSKPLSILEFEDFKQIKMTVNEKQQIKYKEKILQGEKGVIVTDKNVEKGAIVS
jgi:methionyl-tRNA synthetase